MPLDQRRLQIKRLKLQQLQIEARMEATGFHTTISSASCQTADMMKCGLKETYIEALVDVHEVYDGLQPDSDALSRSDIETRPSSVESLCARLGSASGLGGPAISGEQPIQGIPEHALQAHHVHVQGPSLHSTDDLVQEELDLLNADTRTSDMLLNVKQQDSNCLNTDTRVLDERDRFRRSPSGRQHRQYEKPRSFCQESQDYYLVLSQTDETNGRQGYYNALAKTISAKHSISAETSDSQ